MPSTRTLASFAPALLLATVLSACEARPLADATPPCLRCHGGDGLSAPPRSVRGLTETTERAVGAHRRHLVDGPIRAAVACEECHVVPTRIEGHFGDAAATVTWNGPLARARGATPSWDPAAETCAGVYCHGALLAGGTAKTPVWTRVDGSQRSCGSCHGLPPPTPSHASIPPDPTVCWVCHRDTVLPDGTIDVAGGQHVDGTLDVIVGSACDACHPAPPATGAHRAHANPALVSTLSYGSLATLEDVSPSGGTSYEFGCGHCHPLDPADHFADAGGDGLPDVVLSPAGALDRLKARNDPAAAWDPAAGTCSGVACHSSGQEVPAFVVSPAWTATPGSLGCAGCHGNPPRYASGGPGATDANSHLGLDDLGWEYGHFTGLPGPAHNSKHGGGNPAFEGRDPMQAASPITCQACHFETVDPSNVDPSSGGFFWLDTTGDYSLPGGDLARKDPADRKYDFWRHSQCGSCHDGSLAPVRPGRVLPLRHVNGRRDVAFDRRPALPAGYPSGLPALLTADPVRPYYVSHWAVTTSGWTLPPDAVVRETTLGPFYPALTMTLESASYDPSTKTCSNVSCHLAETAEVWGRPYATGLGSTTCQGCHPR